MQVNSVDRSPNWRPTGADLYSTGVFRPAPEHAASAPNPEPAAVSASSVLALSSASTKARAPDQAAPVPTVSNVDWTAKKPLVETPEVPPIKPVYVKLIENLQAMWRASGNAVEVLDEVNKAVNPARLVQGPLVYPDPKLKKVSNN